MIPYGKQDIQEEDITAVVDALRSSHITQGPIVPKFEITVAETVNAKHAVAVNSATSALHIACLALGLGPGDWLWTTPNTFVASANCALYCGAKVDFVDIDPKTYNLCPQELEKKLEQAKRSGKLPKIVVPVHLTGQSCDMASIHSLSDKYGFKIIEDASHAIGAKYNGHPVGSCAFSDITIFSFHPVKIITTGEGGMALTNSPKLACRLNLLRSHGITRDESLMPQKPDGPWHYQQIMLGYNYRMTDIQAALGISQLARLEEYIKRRHAIANFYDTKLKNLPLTLPLKPKDSSSAYHLYVVRLQLENIRTKYLQIFQALRDKNILVNLHYIPVHTQPYYKKMGFKKGDFPESEQYYREALSLPIYPTLTEPEQLHVVDALEQALN